MAEQLSLFDKGTVNSRQFEPVQVAAEGAKRFTGGSYSSEGLENTQANPVRGFRIQQAYRQAEQEPERPGTRRSYAAMRNAVNKQYEFMTAPRSQGGMGLRHEVVDYDPYPSPQAMANDVRKGRIRTFSTEATGGHEYFTNEENDKFRAVHDVFGHAAIGRGFSRHGEEAAFESHRQMFPRAAIPAVTSETRGQNSYFNFRPAGDSEKSFPAQSEKLITLPPFASRVKRKS